MLCLYVQAPFAACRSFAAGWYRPTATFLTPSAAYGLILNVAGIESRLCEEDAAHNGSVPATLMRPELPRVAIALGAPPNGKEGHFPSVQTVYQQLHNYPVGASGQARAASAKGNKYNITPVRREFLADMRVFICIKDNDELEERVRRGLAGEFNTNRYGVLFLGDNAFLIDRLEEPKELPWAHWYRCIRDSSGSSPRPRTVRLTCWIDRADLSRTRSALYAPDETANRATDIPEDAWTVIPPRE